MHVSLITHRKLPKHAFRVRIWTRFHPLIKPNEPNVKSRPMSLQMRKWKDLIAHLRVWYMLTSASCSCYACLLSLAPDAWYSAFDIRKAHCNDQYHYTALCISATSVCRHQHVKKIAHFPALPWRPPNLLLSFCSTQLPRYGSAFLTQPGGYAPTAPYPSVATQTNSSSTFIKYTIEE
jgi:hypothetical protein